MTQIPMARYVPLGILYSMNKSPQEPRHPNFDQVSKSLIIGRAKGVVWPWSRRSSISADGWRGSSRVIQRGPEDGLHIIP